MGGDMSGIGVIWGIAKTAATKVPWGRVVENVPAVVDFIGRAKERFNVPASSQKDFEQRLRLLQDENVKLGKALLQTSDHLREVSKSLEVLAARQKMLVIATAASLLIAISSLILWATG